MNRGALIELFGRIERFFGRLKIYSKVPPSSVVTVGLATLMTDVLLILAIATRGILKGRRLSGSILYGKVLLA